MRAFAIDEFGETGTIRELPIPEPGEGEVVVGVRAAGLNATDLAVMSGYMKDYMPHLFPLVPGLDASGIVERVGPGVDGFHAGDEVYGYTRQRRMGAGTLSEYVVLPADAISRKPSTISYEQAAVIGHAALTAAAAVEDAGVKAGDLVAILGATGGVGSYATQFASDAGATVIAVTRDEHADYAKSLGATETVDYASHNAVDTVRAQHPDGIDALIDFCGTPELVAGMTDLVRKGGHVASTILPPDAEALAAKGIEGTLTTRFTAEHRFPEIAGRIADGSLKIPAIQTFSFDKVGDALELQATRHVAGKVAVTLG
ncbi:MAG TPA: NADP-dependent oxidoreductase [Candidatus Limnocylindrales bacterium]|nr:NADP-dependent oxidoreductase [Candidatus Limnocylindrales bacterium]